jgi:hypothetical protein
MHDFAAYWARTITDADGYPDESLDLAEAALVVRLSAAVREAYGMFGRRADLTSGNGTLYPPDQLHYDATDKVLVFRAAHQAVAYFGVSVTDPVTPGPAGPATHHRGGPVPGDVAAVPEPVLHWPAST